MTRIFLVLVIFAQLLLIVATVQGFTIGPFGLAVERYLEAGEQYHEARGSVTATPEQVEVYQEELGQATRELQPLLDRKTLHVWLGIAATFVTLLVSCVAVTYFIGTSRWCREVIDTYALDVALARQSQKLKRKTFGWSLAAMAVLFAIVIFGAAADPGAVRNGYRFWLLPHTIASLIGVAVIGWSFFVQVRTIGANSRIIDTILACVEAVRRERGLDGPHDLLPGRAGGRSGEMEESEPAS